jgi:hypothetical protein
VVVHLLGEPASLVTVTDDDSSVSYHPPPTGLANCRIRHSPGEQKQWNGDTCREEHMRGVRGRTDELTHDKHSGRGCECPSHQGRHVV